VICVACRADLGRPERVGRRDACPRCSAELHACRQCRFYDPRARDGCREPQAERVLDAARANFCDYFSVAEAPASGAVGSATDATAARAALERLFKR
jgi:hypothetical protein